MSKAKRITLMVSLAMLSAAGGCRRDGQIGNFPAEGERRTVRHIAQLQSAAGARADATLQPRHFDGNELNSLGREKLMLMSQPSEAGTLVVYLNLPADAEENEPRQKAVMAYLNQRGLSEGQARVEIGRNPATLSPAARQLEAIESLKEQQKQEGQAKAFGEGFTSGMAGTK